MRVGLVVDSGCDMPWSLYKENNVVVLPIAIRIEDQLINDDRDPQRTQDFYHTHVGDKTHSAESVPFSVEQIQDLFLKQVVIDFDYVLCQTITQTRSPIYDNATKASFAILNGYKKARQASGVEGPFALRVMDTRTLFAGQGLIAAETLRLIKANTPINKIRQKVDNLTRQTYAYAVLSDLYYARERGRKKGDRSVTWLNAVMGTALDIKPILLAHDGQTEPVAKVRHYDQAVEKLMDYAVERIREGLLAPYVCMSYAGDPEIIKDLPGYNRVAEAAAANDVEILTTAMGITGGVNLGPDTFSLAVAAPKHNFE